MYVNFEIAAFFPSPYSLVKKGGNFKTNIHLDSLESFLNYLSSSRVLVIQSSRDTSDLSLTDFFLHDGLHVGAIPLRKLT